MIEKIFQDNRGITGNCDRSVLALLSVAEEPNTDTDTDTITETGTDNTTNAKTGNQSGFLASFGRTRDPFPTLLAGTVDVFAYWVQGKEEEGFVRKLTPLEC